MASPKYALPLPGGGTFVGRVAETLRSAGCDPIVVVVRPGAEPAVRNAMGGVARCTTLVVNPHPERGQLSSIQAGIQACDPASEPVLLTLVDLPLVTVATVGELYDAWRRTQAPLVRPARGHDHGHPILLGRRAVEALRTADPEAIARDVLRLFHGSAIDVAVNDEGAFADVDTPDEYERLLRERGADALRDRRGSEDRA